MGQCHFYFKKLFFQKCALSQTSETQKISDRRTRSGKWLNVWYYLFSLFVWLAIFAVDFFILNIVKASTKVDVRCNIQTQTSV